MNEQEAIKFLTENGYNVTKLNEGIDIDYENKIVKYNPAHQKNVDTSIECNPTIDDELIPGINVWSIFKRKRSERMDGNPLVYALKGENGWNFSAEEDKAKIMEQFNKIVKKYVDTHSFDVTLVLPSTNELNMIIAKAVIDKIENVDIINDVVCKLTTGDVEDLVMDSNSKFRKYYKGEFNDAFKRLGIYLDKMDVECKGTFKRHYIKDTEMRDVLDFTFKKSEDKIAEYANKINDKDVLIIDDTISRGQSIKDMVKIIKNTYTPKSITVLTLFSKLS